MKIIEGMKELSLISKKLTVIKENLSKYSSLLSCEKPIFDSEQEQRDEILKLIQSGKDLITRWIYIKTAIEHTNLITRIKVCGKRLTIAEALHWKRSMCQELEALYKCLTNTQSCAKLNNMMRGITSLDNPITIVAMYDEKKKNEWINEHTEFIGSIDSTLEITNAITELIDVSDEPVK